MITKKDLIKAKARNRKKDLELFNLLKDIEDYGFNWHCGCESCSNIKMKILNYNQENKEKI